MKTRTTPTTSNLWDAYHRECAEERYAERQPQRRAEVAMAKAACHLQSWRRYYTASGLVAPAALDRAEDLFVAGFDDLESATDGMAFHGARRYFERALGFASQLP